MLETERLFLRPMNEGDADAIFKLRSDEELMRFIREPQTNRAEASDWLHFISSLWASDNIGFCAVIEKSSNKFIGWCGLWRLKETGETEVGYAIAGDFQNQGLASEAAGKCLEYGFEKLNLDKIVAVARPENTASRRVMEKIGMQFDFTGRFYDRDLAHYSISREKFQNDRRNLPDENRPVNFTLTKMLETERLFFRKFTPADLDTLIEQRSDPEVNKYLGGTKMQNPASLAKRLRFYIDCYDEYGFGTSAMIWKETGEIIGSSGIQPLDGTAEIEVGYSIIKKFWRRGIGLESANAWLNFGFNEKNLQRIVGVCHPENVGSRRILEKCGMIYEKIETHYGMECIFYGVSREEFARLNK